MSFLLLLGVVSEGGREQEQYAALGRANRQLDLHGVFPDTAV